MPVKYTHSNIIARDWRVLADFYTKVFDCIPLPPERHLSGEWLEKGTGVKDAFLQGIHLLLPGYDDKGPTLEIFSYAQMKKNLPPAANRLGLMHLAFCVEDVHNTLAIIIENGGKTLGEIVTRNIAEVGTLTFVYATDPEGNILEIQHWTYE